MTRDELIAEARGLGYTHIEAFGGTLALADWYPYGIGRPGTISCHDYAGELIPEPDGAGHVIRDVNSQAVAGWLVTPVGTWPLTREGAQ